MSYSKGDLIGHSLPAGTVIHWHGFPFYLAESVNLLGAPGSFEMAVERMNSGFKPDREVE